MYHQERQSIHISELSDLSVVATDVCTPSPPWIRDLIMKKREKLVDIVNSATKQEHTSEHISSPSKSGITSIGSNTSLSTLGSSNIRLSPKPSTGALTNGCISCVSQPDTCHCISESGLNSKKAVHLINTTASTANVPIVRSVSSSLVTDPPCLLLSESGCDLTLCLSKAHRFNNLPLNCFASHSSDLNGENISPGLVAARKKEYLKRQVSESSYFFKTCNICGTQIYAPNSVNSSKNTFSDKMIDEKNKDQNEIFKNDKNNHRYEVIIDYKRSDSANNSEKDINIKNGMDIEENEYEYKYGPGIVDKLKLKFMSISIQQQTNDSIFNKLKRCSSLETIAVSNDSRLYKSQLSDQSQHLNGHKHSQNNDLLIPLLEKNCSHVSVGSITGGGNRANGNHLSNRLYIQHHNSRNIYNNKFNPIVPVMKRAKSMETLLFQDDKDEGRLPSDCLFRNQLSITETPISSQNDLQLVNDNVFIIENTNQSNQNHNRSNDDKVNQSTMKSANNLNSHSNDELPRPDTVKTYKRMFEPIKLTSNGTAISSNDTAITTNNNISNKSKNNYKKILPPTNGNVKRKPPVVRATNKSASVKSQTVSQSLSTNSTLPTIKSKSTEMPQPIPSAVVHTSVNSNGDNNDRNNNKSANSSVLKKPPIAPKRASLLSTLKSKPSSGMVSLSINNNLKTNGSVSNNTNNSNKLAQNSINKSSEPKKVDNGIKLISNEALDRIRASGNCVTFNGSDQSVSQIIPTTYDNSSDSAPNNKNKVNKPIANIKPFNQNNDNSQSEIVNNCQPINDHNGRDSGHIRANEIAIGEKASVSVKPIETNYIDSNNRDDKENNETVSQSHVSNGNITNTSSNTNTDFDKSEPMNNNNSNNRIVLNDENISPNNCDSDMVDKNNVQIIDDHDHARSDVLKPSLLLNNTSNTSSANKSPTSSLWSQQNKKHINSSTNTIVFDFRDKDVKPNLAIQPLPFGVSVSLPKRSSNRSAVNGSADDSDDDNYSGSLEIPLPSGILFIGENIIVGKGSILNIRNKKLNIKFNDSATSTFEYPSEASLLADSSVTSHISFSSNSRDETKSETNNAVIGPQSSNNNVTTLTTLKTNLVLGGSSGGLASYKPTLIDKPFELGVSRSIKSNSDKVSNEVNPEINSDDNNDTVKPANPDETTSWSTSSTASDLLF